MAYREADYRGAKEQFRLLCADEAHNFHTYYYKSRTTALDHLEGQNQVWSEGSYRETCWPWRIERRVISPWQLDMTQEQLAELRRLQGEQLSITGLG